MTDPVRLKASSLNELTFPEFFRIALKKLAEKRGVDTQKNLWLREDPRFLHQTVLRLQEGLKDRLPPLRRIRFITRGPFAYSSEIVQALELLQRANAISRENPAYQKFSPKIFKDTYDVVDQEIAELFESKDDEARAFDEFVSGLETLIAEA